MKYKTLIVYVYDRSFAGVTEGIRVKGFETVFITEGGIRIPTECIGIWRRVV